MPDNFKTHRPLYEIAKDIRIDWAAQKKQFPYAAPYREAMADLTHITQLYGSDDAKSIVLYFLSNAATWRGDTAKKIKQELKDIVKSTGYKM